MTEPQRERVLAVLAAVLAAGVVVGARAIEDSLLADAVGAGGVPQGVGLAMGLAAVVLFAKSLRAATPAVADSAGDRAGDGAAGAGSGADDGGGGGVHAQRLRSAAMVLLLLGYAALLPWAGYALAITLLIAAVGALAGAPLRLPLALTAVLGGSLLWLLFDRVLQVRMPSGSLWGSLWGG